MYFPKTPLVTHNSNVPPPYYPPQNEKPLEIPSKENTVWKFSAGCAGQPGDYLSRYWVTAWRPGSKAWAQNLSIPDRFRVSKVRFRLILTILPRIV